MDHRKTMTTLIHNEEKKTNEKQPRSKKKTRSYDCIVLGADLEGLLIAYGLEKRGFSVALIDSRDQAGGTTRFCNKNTLPLQNKTLEHLKWLEKFLNKEILGEQQELPPLTLDKDRILPFLGFAGNPPSFYAELKPHLEKKITHLKLTPQDWINTLTKEFKGDFFPNSHLTKIETQAQQIQGIHVNGHLFYTAKNYFSCLPLKKLVQTLSSDSLKPRSLQKIMKTPLWGTLHWNVKHSEPIYDGQNTFIMPISEKNDTTGVVWGHFLDPHTSSWTTFYPSNENHEVAGNTVKKIKKQVKRLFPEALKTIIDDKLLFIEDTSPLEGLNSEENQVLKEGLSLFLASPQLSAYRGVEGAIERAQIALSSLIGVAPSTKNMLNP